MVRRSVCLSLFVVALSARAEPLPSVASINLCTDQLVLSLADPAQIRSLSWLSADPRESMLADAAIQYPLNFANAEEILRAAPDVVLGGQYTSAFTRSMLASLGLPVITVPPANSVADIERNLRTVAVAIGRQAYAETVIADMRERIRRIEHARPARSVPGIVVRPGGFTVGAGSLADDLMRLAGLENIAAVSGLDVWGSLSIESLLTSRTQLLIFTGYRTDQPSLANAIFAHPLVARLTANTRSTTVDAPLWSCGIPDSLRSAELLLVAIGGDAQ